MTPTPARTLLPLFALLLSLAPACPARAQTPQAPAPAHSPAPPPRPAWKPGTLQALIDQARERHDVPALAAAVVVDGRVVESGVSGVRMRGQPEPATLADLWHLGSCAKAMTATLAGVLVEEGALTWETTLGEAFAGVPMHEGWTGVTLRHLLQHRGGVPGDLSRDGLWPKLLDRRPELAAQRRTLLEGVLSWEPSCRPGEKFEYSNAGYAIAGMMLEARAKKPYEQLVVERLFTPLGITSAGFGAPGENQRGVPQPRGHRQAKPYPMARDSSAFTWALADNPPAITAAGRIHMTIEDWARFAAVHAVGELDDARRAGVPNALLSRDAFRTLHAPATPGEGSSRGYALGWGVVDRRDAQGRRPPGSFRALTHAGSNTRWYGVAWVLPDEGFAVVVATNQGDAGAPDACDAVASGAIDELARARPEPEERGATR